jgi:hypothetical protein
MLPSRRLCYLTVSMLPHGLHVTSRSPCYRTDIAPPPRGLPGHGHLSLPDLLLRSGRMSIEHLGQNILKYFEVIYGSVPKQPQRFFHRCLGVLPNYTLHQSARRAPPQIAGKGQLHETREANGFIFSFWKDAHRTCCLGHRGRSGLISIGEAGCWLQQSNTATEPSCHLSTTEIAIV